MQISLGLESINEEITQGIKISCKILGIKVASDDASKDYANTLILNLKENKNEDFSTYYIENNILYINYCKRVHIYRILGLVKENKIFESDKSNKYTLKSNYDSLTFMLDNSRNAVLNLASAKRLISYLSLMGYTGLMLYTEDTYEVEGHPYFGHMRGRFSQNEIAEIDSFCQLLGIELIPCIQTLAHLNAMFRWSEYKDIRDVNDILLAEDDNTYELIESFFSQIKRTFTSKKINIGMDEAYLLGRGKYLRINGYKKSSQIMLNHLNRVLELCKKYDLEPMMWSDMFFNNGDEKSKDILKHDDFKYSDILTIVHWDYYNQDTNKYISNLQKHKDISDKVGFAGGAWKWDGYIPFNNFSFNVSKSALEACKEENIRDIILTSWGDDGAEASVFSVLPTMQLYAEYCYLDNPHLDDIKSRFKTCTNANWDDFMSVDMLNLVPENDDGTRSPINPGKYLFYQDILLGLYDKHVKIDEFSDIYKKAIIKLSEVSEREKEAEWNYLFELYKSFAQFMSIKVDLGVKLTKAYKGNDVSMLKQIIEEISQMENYLVEFHEKVRYQWFYENKAFGFEVIDIRLGGLKSRIASAKIRLQDYISGKIGIIEELEEDRLYADCRKSAEPNKNLGHVHAANWKEIVSTNNI